MQDTIVFNGPSALDFQDIRTHVIRIPEVISRLRQAQEIWDRSGFPEFDLANFIASEDRIFLGNIRLKSLAAAVVQVGLYDRYIKHHRTPAFIIGNFNGDSAMKVVAGMISFEELVMQSNAFRVNKPIQTIQLADAPLLAGISLTEYGILKKTVKDDKETFEKVEEASMEIDKIIDLLVDEYEVKKFINIGPGNTLLQKSPADFSLRDVQVLESIDLDPLLSWFWSNLKEAQMVG